MKISLLILIPVILFKVALSAQDTITQYNLPTLENSKAIMTFKKNKFSFDEYQNEKIENRFLGLIPYGYTKKFKQTIETNPYAYRILKRSYQYQAIETSSTTIAWGLIIRQFLELTNLIKRVSQDDFYPGNTTSVTDNTTTIITYSFAIYGAKRKSKYIKLAIEEFNNPNY
jgi:hypothetical protein